jgi:hypothetical protein
MCHTPNSGQRRFPWFSLEFARRLKKDLRASVAELVYGEPLRIPGELLTPTAEPVDSAHLITELRQHMARLRPIPAARHASPSTFVHSDLERCTHVFLHQDTTRQALEPPIQRLLPGPVTEREDSATSCAREACHCVNRQGQAGLHPQRDRPREQLQPASRNNPGRNTTSHAATAIPKNYTIQSSHPFPCSLKHLSSHLRGGGGGGMWEPPTVQNRQLSPCSKSRRYLYTTDCSLAVGHPHKRYPTSANS